MDRVRPYPRLRGSELWDIAKPPDAMVWELCPYIIGRDNQPCLLCPEWQDEIIDGRLLRVQRMCYALADEACRVVLAMQKITRREDSG